jgi:hypothetical protein
LSRNKPSDPQGRHIRVYVSLLNGPAWRVLGWSARSLFVDLRAGVTGTNNGNISATLPLLKHRGWASASTLASAIYELRALGFIAVTREGGLRQGTRVPTLYRFTDLETHEYPKLGIQACKATYDYLRHETVAAAQAALSDGVRTLRDRGRAKQRATKNPPVRNPNRNDSESEPEGRSIDSDSEQGTRSSIRNPNREIRRSIARKAA